MIKKIAFILVSMFVIGCSSSDPSEEDLCSCRKKIIKENYVEPWRETTIEYRAPFTIDCSEVVTDSIKTFDGIYNITYVNECKSI